MKWASRRDLGPSIKSFSSLAGSRVNDDEGSDFEPVDNQSGLNDSLVGEEAASELFAKINELASRNPGHAAVYLLRHWNNAGFPQEWRHHFREMICSVALKNGRAKDDFDEQLGDLETRQAESGNQSKWHQLDIRITIHHQRYLQKDLNRKRNGQRIVQELGGTIDELCINCNESVGFTIEDVESRFAGGPKLRMAHQYTPEQKKQRMTKKFCLACRDCGYHLEVRNRAIVEIEKKPVEKLVSPEIVGGVLNIKKNTVSQYYRRARLELAELEPEKPISKTDFDHVRDEDLAPFRLNEDIDSFLRQKVCSDYQSESN